MLAGKKLLVTAGPTREYLDPVRYLSNDSSGRMGFAVAAEAARRRARVTLLTGPVSLQAPRGVSCVRVVSARQMHKAALRFGKKADAVVAAAAVSDWRPLRPSRRKVKKSSRPGGPWNVPFARNPDILKDLSKLSGRRVLVGFALETDHLLRNARKKLKEKNLDLVVANTPAAFAARRSTVFLLEADGKVSRFSSADKSATAKRILNVVESKLELR